MRDHGRKPCYNCGSTNTIRYVTSLMADMPEILEERELGITKVKAAGVGGGAGSHYECQECGYRWESFQEHYLDARMKERIAQGKDRYMHMDISKKSGTQWLKKIIGKKP